MKDDETIWVTWYEHDCPWITKHCDDFHREGALVPLSVIKEYQ